MKHSIFTLFVLLFLSFQTLPAQTPYWITAQQNQSATNTWLTFRKDFSINNVPAKAISRIAADSKYWMWINGELAVFEGSLKRGPNPNDTYVDEVDIAPFLKSGKNTLSILLWHYGKESFSHNSSGKAALFFDCADLNLYSDNSWNADVHRAYENTTAPYPNWRLPESNVRFDARNDNTDWIASQETNSRPAHLICKEGDAPFNKLVKRPIPMFKDYGLKAYPSTRKSGDTLICTLPYNAQVTPYFKVNAPEGKLIEMITDNYRGGGENNVRAEYITKNGTQEYESLGWMNGHEMFYIIPQGVEVLDVKFRETGYDTEFSGSFSCNDPFYNKLWQKSARTLYITMRDNYMDCPDRERAQWWGDAVNELGEAFYALDTKSQQLAYKGILELMNWQRPDGTIYSPIPSNNWHSELPLQMLTSVGHYGFYTQYLYSGDSTFVPLVYDRLKIYLHDVWKQDRNGLVIPREGGWYWGDWGQYKDKTALAQCWYYLALQAQLKFAGMVEVLDDEYMIREKMDRLKKAFHKNFWNGKEYRSSDYTETTDDRTQAMAVLSGLAPKEVYPQIAKILAQEYHASPYMEKYVLEALFFMGYEQQALDRMKKRFQKNVDEPHTTLWEGWGIGPDGFGGGTINHAWSGGGLTLLSQYVCGIAPIEPGFKRFKVQPMPGKLTDLNTSLDTHYGAIGFGYKKARSGFTMTVTVPEDTEAEIFAPKGQNFTALEGHSGKIDKKKVTVQSGTYLFRGR